MERRGGNHNPLGIGGFKKGQVANPTGRPKKTPEENELEQACRLASLNLLPVLIGIAEDEHAKSSDRIAAIKAIYERGHGAPRQHNTIAGDDTSPLIPKLEIVVRDKPE